MVRDNATIDGENLQTDEDRDSQRVPSAAFGVGFSVFLPRVKNSLATFFVYFFIGVVTRIARRVLRFGAFLRRFGRTKLLVFSFCRHDRRDTP